MADVKIRYVVDNKEIKEIRKDLEDLKKKVGEIETKGKKGFKSVGKEAGTASKEVKKLTDYIAAIGTFATIAKLTTEFAELTQEMIKARKEVVQLTGLIGGAADKITTKVKTTADVFDKEFNEVLRVANTLSKQFSISMTDAVDVINDGMAKGLDINGEYLDTLKEYSTFFNEAGYSAKQFNAIIQKQLQSGIFSDKGADAIHEALFSIREMTPATQQAIEAIGISAAQVSRDIQNGVRTYADVIDEILKKTKAEMDPRKVGAIYADVFKGAGEETGKFLLTLTDVGDATSDLNTEAQAYYETSKQLIEKQDVLNEQIVIWANNWKAAKPVLLSIWTDLKTAGMYFVNEVVQEWKSHETLMDEYLSGLKSKTDAELKVQRQRLEAQLAAAEKAEREAKHAKKEKKK